MCSTCQEKKPAEQFSWRNRKKGIKHKSCKDCHSQYRREHYLANKEKYKAKARRWDRENRTRKLNNAQQYVLEYLLEHPCVDCGIDDPVVLEFDHVRGTKKAAISSMIRWNVSMAALKTEIAKCDVRCANCHRRRTAEERGWYILDVLEATQNQQIGV